MRCLLSTDVAGIVIGKGGANVKATREASGCFVSLSNNTMQATERILTIKGARARIPSAVGIVSQQFIEAGKCWFVSFCFVFISFFISSRKRALEFHFSRSIR